MAISEKRASLRFHRIQEERELDHPESEGSVTEEYASDEDNDPTFDILEETNSLLLNLSVDNKSKSRTSKWSSTEGVDFCMFDQGEVTVPKLDEKGEKTFDKVQSIIKAGQLDKLKLDQCKIYLRKHALRLTGNKDTLIRRIKEHLDVINGGGEKKYPASSFVWSCKGDACTGDVVLFEQKVYEMFNIASRSASGPPLGTRTVAGRVVKESYGSAKQQHTFTIEVLWSKGERPFPPLHPFLIKGRNLYRLKTLRQIWDDEKEREKALLEKHSRGKSARANRDVRIKEKENRKNLKAAREPRKAKFQPGLSSCVSPTAQPQKHQIELLHTQKQQNHQIGHFSHKAQHRCGDMLNANHSQSSFRRYEEPASSSYVNNHPPRQPLANVNGHRGIDTFNASYRQSSFRPHEKQPVISSNVNNHPPRQPINDHYPSVCRAHGQGYQKAELCRHYIRGRCYYGDNCKYLH